MAKRFRFPAGGSELANAAIFTAAAASASDTVKEGIRTIARIFGDRDRALEDYLNTLPTGGIPFAADDGSYSYQFDNAPAGQFFWTVFDDANANHQALINLAVDASGAGSAEVDVLAESTTGKIASVSALATAAASFLTLRSDQLGFYGVAAVAQPAHPVTLGDVIAALTALGLTA